MNQQTDEEMIDIQGLAALIKRSPAQTRIYVTKKGLFPIYKKPGSHGYYFKPSEAAKAWEKRQNTFQRVKPRAATKKQVA